MYSVLLFPNALPDSPETVGHDCADCEKVGSGSEAASWEVATVLDGLVAASWGHVLRHGGGGGSGVAAEGV